MPGSPLVLVNQFQPANYQINLSIDHQKSNFTGEIIISLSKDSKHVPETETDFKFQLNSAELAVLNGVFSTTSGVDHKAKITYNRPNEIVELIVENGANLYKESELKLTIKYLGKINSIKTYRDFTKGIFKTNYLDDRNNNSTNYIIATHSQASFARYIYPSIDEPASKATFQLSLTTAKDFKVLSNTLPESRTTESSNQTITFEKSPPMNTSIFGFIIGDLDFIESTIQLSSKSIPVRFYTPIGQVQQSAYAHDITSKLLPKIESIFNTPYPLSKLDIVALPFLSDGAMENFGLITIQSSHVLVETLSNKPQLKQIRQLIAHELIHHWIGNDVSFDEWDHLWLNEAFATWFAYYVLAQVKIDDEDLHIWEEQGDVELEKLFTTDSAIGVKSVVGKLGTGVVKTTQDAFEVHSYSKGIQFLRMLSNVFENDQFNDQLPKFVSNLSKFITENHFKTIKPTDLWKNLHQDSSLDLLAFTHSWLRTPGFPLVSVSINQDDKIVLEQHRYLEESTVQEQNLEDVPYHVPLAIKLNDGSVVNKVLNDRKLILEEIKVEEFVKLNTNRIGLYRVHYKDSKLYENIVENFDSLSTLDLLGLVHDLSRIIGHDSLQSDQDIVGFLEISQSAVNSSKPNFEVLRYILNNLEVLENAYKLQSANKKHAKFVKWLRQLNLDLFNKLDWSQVDNASTAEIETRASILSIGIETPEIHTVSEKFFKKLLHGPRQSVPVQFLSPILSSVSLSANQTTWKKILELVKAPGATTANVDGGSIGEIQNAAIKAIGYTKDPALVKRVLNFVTTNIDSTMVELGLVGLLYNPSLNKQTLWDWFKLNYDHWASRSLRAGSEYSAKLKKTVKSITLIVLSAFTRDEDSKIVQRFVDERLKKLPEHGLKENVELVKESQVEKIKIASSIDSVLKFIE